jgi:hypothetical protein
MRPIARRLARLEKAAAARPAGAEVSPPALPQRGEVAALVPQLARSLQASVEYYEAAYSLPPQEAQARADAAARGAVAQTNRIPADLVSWDDLATLYRADPAAALEKWLQMREAAREELQSGARAATSVQPFGASPWWLARFLAVRDELGAGVQPRNGGEQLLIDLAAQVHCLLLSSQEELTARTALANAGSRRDPQKDQPRLDDAQAVEQALATVERLHALFLRAVKALQDMRRKSPRVIVRRAGQVNVADQQVNVCGATRLGGRGTYPSEAQAGSPKSPDV